MCWILRFLNTHLRRDGLRSKLPSDLSPFPFHGLESQQRLPAEFWLESHEDAHLFDESGIAVRL
jgi:hypothetical protein